MTDLNEIPKAKKVYPHCLRFVLKGVWFDKIKSGAVLALLAVIFGMVYNKK